MENQSALHDPSIILPAYLLPRLDFSKVTHLLLGPRHILLMKAEILQSHFKMLYS